MLNVKDKGHKYELLVIDGNGQQVLTFVKRQGKKFPRNNSAYEGTTLQSVIRALNDRIKYLQRQSWCFENILILKCLRLAIWLLEFRAARRHKEIYIHGLDFAMYSEMCRICGHTFCDKMHLEW